MKPAPQGRPLNVRLRRRLDVILTRPQYLRLERPWDVSLGDVDGGRPRDVLETNICRLGCCHTEEQKRDEQWFDEVDHDICTLKQKINCWIRDAELERKASLISHVSCASGKSGSKH